MDPQHQSIRFVSGTVTSPQGFVASGIHCGIRKNKNKRDLALIYCKTSCHTAAVYTKNLIQGAPLIVTRQHLRDGKARAILCNSGNANACTADGLDKAQHMSAALAKKLDMDPEDVIVASTGIIGQSLPIEPITTHIDPLIVGLSTTGGHHAAQAIMTTDTFTKEAAVELMLGGQRVVLGGMCKGSGMIHPNMATMLCFITTDASLPSAMLQKALHSAMDRSFHMLSVDGDCSTNDMVTLMASGMVKHTPFDEHSQDFELFCEALTRLCQHLAKMIAKDGEGASKLLICQVSSAVSEHDAALLAKAVIRSNLLKAAMFSADANWGRILSALDASGANIDPQNIRVSLRSSSGLVHVCHQGTGIDFCEEQAKHVLKDDEIHILVQLDEGSFYAEAYGCDLTHDYVTINGAYRT